MPIDPSVLLKQTPIDIGGAIGEGANANFAVTRANAARTEFNDSQNDAAVIKDYSALPGTDLYTTKGLADAQDHLRGRISAKSFMELGDRFTKAQGNEIAYKSNALKYSKTMLEAEHDDNEFVVRNLAAVFNAPDPATKAQLRADAIDRMALATKPDGSPRLTPKQVENLRQTPDTAFDALYTTSDYKKAVNKDLLDQATVKEKNARAAQLEGIGPTDQYTSPDGKSYVKAIKTGQVYLVDANDNYTPAPFLPPGSVNIKTPPKVNALDQRITTQKKYTSDLLANPTAGLLSMAVDNAITNAPLGLGPTDPSRPAAMMLARVLKETPEGMAAASDYKAKTGALMTFERMKAITTANEVTAENLLAQVQPLLEKGVTSPTDIKFINNWLTSYKRAIGDVDVAKVDLFEKALKADVARIQSGSTSAVSTPVAFLKNGEVILPMGMKTTDYADIIKAIKQDMGARISANNEIVRQIKADISTSRLNLSKVAARAAKIADSTDPADFERLISGTLEAPKPATHEKVTPADQKARNVDSVEIIRSELVKARAQYRTETDPAKKTRLEADIKGLEREIKAIGGKVEAEPPAPAGAVSTERQEELNKKYGL